jgi:iron complex outermembrane receptor protein
MIAIGLLVVLVSGSAPDSVTVPARADTVSPAARDTASSSPATRPSVTDTVTVLPEVRVHQRPDEGHTARRSPASFAREIPAGSTGHAFETVTELLARSPGVRVGQYGGLGAFSTVSVRGSRAGQVSIYLDGVPMTSASHSVVNLSDLPSTLLRRIEIYPMAPLDLGPVTPGGAIDFVTPSEVRSQHVYASRGSFGSWSGLATAGGARDAWSGLLHVGAQGSRGDFVFLDDNGTPLNLADDENAYRQNNGYDAITALARGAWTPADNVRVSVRGNLFTKRQGMPGRGSIPALHASLANRLTQGVVEAETGVTRGWPGVRLRYVNDAGRSRFRDTGNELKTGVHDTDDGTRSDLVSMFSSTPRLAGGVTVEGSASLRVEHAELHDSADRYADPPPSRRTSQGASLTARLEPWRDVLLLQAGRRWDRQHDALRSLTTFGTVQASNITRELSTPQLGVRIRPGAGLELRANWARTARAPEFMELFGNQGSVAGNPLLPPEHAETWDAGGSWTFAIPSLRFSATAAHYESDARDLIEYVRNTPNSVRAQSISRARIRGEELGVSASTSFGIALMGAVTLQTARDEGDVPYWHGRWLPLEPERHGYGSLMWRFAALRVAADVEVIGRTYVDRANREPSPSRTLPGVSVSTDFPGGMRVTLEGKNLGDVRAFDVANYPLPGRSLFASCEWTLGPRSTSRP